MYQRKKHTDRHPKKPDNCATCNQDDMLEDQKKRSIINKLKEEEGKKFEDAFWDAGRFPRLPKKGTKPKNTSKAAHHNSKRFEKRESKAMTAPANYLDLQDLRTQLDAISENDGDAKNIGGESKAGARNNKHRNI